MRFALLRKPPETAASTDGKQRRRVPRLERLNAAKNIDYEATSCSSHCGSTYSSLGEGSFEPFESVRGESSFRVGGAEEGEFDRICRSLGLSGPDDFAISIEEWQDKKVNLRCPGKALRTEEEILAEGVRVCARVSEDSSVAACTVLNSLGGDCGIKGIRPPPILAPPSNSPSVLGTYNPTREISHSSASERNGVGMNPFRCVPKEREGYEVIGSIVGREEKKSIRLRESGDYSSSYSFSTSNDGDDDSPSSTATEGMLFLTPDASFRISMRSWTRGDCLGSGSFGTVYEGYSEVGIFFAVKEVSLLDQGSQAQQCILQLQHEIALLSQFEHENIVRYYGTDKEEAKLYIFLELVTKGSLQSLYQKYQLQDSQVSVYTKQILNGLKYLHDRDVIHRDIKCANILVDANGSVKLADFGLAKETSRLNMLKSCRGSVHWMAPEVVNPRKTYGVAADIWSLGCTVLEMLTRQLPYANLEWPQALFRIGRGEAPPIPRSLSRDARKFIRKCLQVIPENRPSAADLLNHPFVKKELQP